MCIIYLTTLTLLITQSTSLWFNISDTTLPTATIGEFLAIYNGLLITGAGANNYVPNYTPSQWINGSQSISLPLNTNQWTEYHGEFPLPYPASGDIKGMMLEGDNSVQVGNKVYIINPWILLVNYDDSVLNYNYLPGGKQMFIYDLSATTNQNTQYNWGPAWPFSSRKHYGCCTTYDPTNHIIYTMNGGYDDTMVQRFNVSSNTWMASADGSLFSKTDIGCAYDYNGHIFSFGGWGRLFVSGQPGNTGTLLSVIEMYSVVNDDWTQLSTTLSLARRRPVCRYLDLNGYIYCMGGKTAYQDHSTVVDVFDPVNNLVVNTIHLNTERINFNAIVWNDNGVSCLIVCGGQDSDLQLLNSIEYLGDCTAPTNAPSQNPTTNPSQHTLSPTNQPSQPSSSPTFVPTWNPTKMPTFDPTNEPTNEPTTEPTTEPTIRPSNMPSAVTTGPTFVPSQSPTRTTINGETNSSNSNKLTIWIFVTSVLSLYM